MSNLRVAVLFLLTGVIWGFGFVFIRVAMVDLAAIQLTFARTGLAAITLTIAMFLGRREWPTGWFVWKRISIIGILGMFMPFYCMALAGDRIPSALSSIYTANIPIVTALVTLLLLKQETLGIRKLIAIGLGTCGVLIVLSPWSMEHAEFDLMGQLFALLAVTFMGFGFAYTRKAVTPLNLDPVGVIAGQTFVATLFAIPLFLASEPLAIRITPQLAINVIMLGVFTSALGFLWNYKVIAHWGASSASMIQYVTTLVGVSAGMLVLGEVLKLQHIIGGAIILFSIGINIFKRRNAGPPMGVS